MTLNSSKESGPSVGAVPPHQRVNPLREAAPWLRPVPWLRPHARPVPWLRPAGGAAAEHDLLQGHAELKGVDPPIARQAAHPVVRVTPQQVRAQRRPQRAARQCDGRQSVLIRVQVRVRVRARARARVGVGVRARVGVRVRARVRVRVNLSRAARRSRCTQRIPSGRSHPDRPPASRCPQLGVGGDRQLEPLQQHLASACRL